ncbi:hypothetical protein [Streptomyces sp. NPDC002671]
MNRYTFAAWDRAGAAASLTDPDDLVRTVPVRGQIQSTVTVNSGPQNGVILQLYGPGDVKALDIRQIVRLYPRPGTPDAETTNFPLVEFDRTDLPWMFTPLAAGPSGSLRPWLSLVCVPAGLRPVRLPARPLPVLQLTGEQTARELPDPAFLHLWAHIQQLSGDQNDTRRSVSRLMAPRKLVPHTDYTACLVPAFEIGRRAGTGEDGGDLSPAWTPGVETTLPVYFSWSFSTGEAGDFETLATRLRAARLSAKAGLRPLDVSNPGLLARRPGPLVQQAESALQSPDLPARAAWPVDAASAAWRRALATALGTAQDDGNEDPSVLPPLYGGFHALRASVDADATGWVDSLNLDPRWRVAAGLGTRSVQDEQETLMASAWRQLADVQAANRFLDLARLARLVGTRLYDRHITPLSADEMLHLASPLRARAPSGDVTLEARIQDSSLPLAMASTAFRRLTRPLGPLSRRVARAAGSGGAAPDRVPFATVISGVAASPVGLRAPRSEPDGAVSFATRPQGLVAADRLPAVLATLGLADQPPQAWLDLAAKAEQRAAARDVPSDRLAQAPAVPEPVLGSVVRLGTLPELLVPPRFFTETTLTPNGELVFPSGHRTPGGLLSLAGPADADSTFTGGWHGPYTNDPAQENTAGGWSGDCAGTFSVPGMTGTQWQGRFVGTWQLDRSAPDFEAAPGPWRAVFAGSWSSDQDHGTWQGVCTGTLNLSEITSDGNFTGTWRSQTRHGSWYGTSPGTWDSYNPESPPAATAAGIWQSLCEGAAHRADDAAPPPDIPQWQPDHLPDVLGEWRPDAGLPLDHVCDSGYLSRQADALPAPAVLGLGPGDVQDAVVAAHQRLVRAADAPPLPAQETIPVPQARDHLAATLDPAQAVAAVTAARIERPPQAGGTDDTPIMWAPSFPDPMWQPLAAQSTEWLLAGLHEVEPDTATLAVTNSAFVEAYLIGLNHEFGRELRWREYPAFLRGTYFSVFWGAGPDIPSIPAWQAALPLGSHRPAQPERAVLVLRSALLRRYPGAIVYVAPFTGGQPDDAQAHRPIFRGAVDADTTFLGFDISADDLLASPWCFVIAEQPSEPRFGLDDQRRVFGQPYERPSRPDSPNNLTWSDLFDGPEAMDAATYAPGALRRNVAPDELVWGSDSAGIARQTFQQPVRVVLPAAMLLKPPPPPPPASDEGVPG